MEKRKIKLSDVVKIKYASDVTIYYTVDKFYICVIGSEQYEDEFVWVVLASRGVK